MNWDKETVVRFLELYQMNPCIWDPQNEGHKNRQRVNDAWNTIKDNLDVPCSLQDLKKKKESLMSAYRGYKTKVKKSERSGSGIADVYQPSWFAFALMDSFLNSVYTCNSTIDTEKTHNQEPIINSKQGPSDQNTRSQEKGSTEQCATARTIQNNPIRRRQNNPPELIEAKKRMDEAYSFMQHSQRQLKDEDDECSAFGVLVARKLRRLSEERRDIMMAKIHQLFIDEHVYNFSLSNYSSSRPNSAATMLSYTPSPPQINIASPPAVASSPQAAFSFDMASRNSATSHPNSAATMLSYTPSPPQINIASPLAVASSPEVAFSSDMASFDSATSHPNSATTMLSYTPSPPQIHTAPPLEVAFPTEVASLNCHPNSTTRVSYTPSSPQTDAPSPAYYVEYSNDNSFSLPNPTSRMVSYTQSPLQIPRGNHTVTSPTAVSHQKPKFSITRNTVSEGTSDVLKDFIIIRQK